MYLSFPALAIWVTALSATIRAELLADLTGLVTNTRSAALFAHHSDALCVFADDSLYDYDLILNHETVAGCADVTDNGCYFSTQFLIDGLENAGSNPEDVNTYSVIGNLGAGESYESDSGFWRFKVNYGYADGTETQLIWAQDTWLSEYTVDVVNYIDVPAQGRQGIKVGDVEWFNGLRR